MLTLYLFVCLYVSLFDWLIIYQFVCPTKSKMTEKAYGLKVCVDSISGSFLISRFCLTTLPQLDNYATPEVDEEEDVIQGGDEDDHVK